MHAPDSQVVDKQSTLPGLMARVWWMFPGNLFLVFPMIFIFQSGGGFFQTADWVFWIALASLVLIRYVDIRFLNGCTAAGAYASVTHWIRYAVILTACSTALWVLAHVAGHLFARGAPQG